MTFLNNIVGPLPFQNLRWLEGVWPARIIV